MIKALSELETPKPQTLIPEAKPKPKQTPKSKQEIRVNKKKLKTLREYLDELRHKFSKKEIDTEKLFMLLKTKKYLSDSEIKKTNKSY